MSKMSKLRKLEYEKIELENELKAVKQENLKKSCIRNLKIFGNTCNFLLPFVVVGGITVGAFYIFDGGLPFKEDLIPKYKVSSLQIKDDSIKTEEVYKSFWDTQASEKKLKVPSSWQKKDDGSFARTIRTYNLNSEYIIEAILVDTDRNIKIMFPESATTNIKITIIEVIIILAVGGFIACNRDFEFLDSIDYNMRTYKKESTKQLKLDLKDVCKRIEELNKRVNSYGKK